jgi:hypothetical protein
MLHMKSSLVHDDDDDDDISSSVSSSITTTTPLSDHVECISMIWKKKKAPPNQMIDLRDVATCLPGFQYVTQPIHIDSNQVPSIEEFIYIPQMKQLYDTNMLIQDFLHQVCVDNHRGRIPWPTLDHRQTFHITLKKYGITFILLFRLVKYHTDTLLFVFPSQLVWRFQYQVVCLSSSYTTTTTTQLQHLASQFTQHHIEDLINNSKVYYI